ncbi:hypothetical protein A3F03_01770 [Candidatus Roizmanbacteria bacterium RIFCSPHIGHO2_12_FULL_41_11]|uniref:Polymerase beta nucleotidyltransferase domain-containing protein n=1 Tax=Candidatus Roizmanbacteria bacterium RIFCSPHIGHO2_12_FULL_41_11 TaxID=1802052 RepID=A0A1F7I098_9BACT|nr:MAG: hypothetical protein A3F03_01770 [Candidatus Roizmanbacteria bacterium RIFCSPHIGHO2_12_FULL_41_11]
MRYALKNDRYSPSVKPLIAKVKRVLPFLVKQYHIKSLGVFGSYVQNKQSSRSDLDLLVEFSKTPGLLKFIELENRLTDLLGIRVDLVMKDTLKPVIGKHILREVISV